MSRCILTCTYIIATVYILLACLTQTRIECPLPGHTRQLCLLYKKAMRSGDQTLPKLNKHTTQTVTFCHGTVMFEGLEGKLG